MDRNGWVPVSRIAQNLVKRTAGALHDLSETLQDNSGDPNNRKRLLATLEIKRHEFQRLLVVVKYARNFSEYTRRLKRIAQITQRRDEIFGDTKQALQTIAKASVEDRSFPMWDVTAALHVMTAGSYRLLPKVIEKQVKFTRNVSDVVIDRTIRRLNDKLWIRLLSTRIPTQISKVRVEGGIAFLCAPGEFEIGVSLRMKPSDTDKLEGKEEDRIHWVLLKIDVLVGSDPEKRKRMVLPQHISMLMQRLNDLILAEPEPIVLIYNRLHIFCLRLCLGLLHRQTQYIRSRFGDKYSVSYKRHEEMVIEYWKDAPQIPVEGQIFDFESKMELDVPLAASNTSAAKSLKISNSSLKIGIDRHDLLSVTHNPPLLWKNKITSIDNCGSVHTSEPKDEKSESLHSTSYNSDTLPGVSYDELDIDKLLQFVVVIHANDRILRLKRFIEAAAKSIDIQCFHSVEIKTPSTPCRHQSNFLLLNLTKTYQVKICTDLRTGEFFLRWQHTTRVSPQTPVATHGDAKSEVTEINKPRLQRLATMIQRGYRRDCQVIVQNLVNLRVRAILEEITDILVSFGLHVSDNLTAHWSRPLASPFGKYALFAGVPRWRDIYLGINIEPGTLTARAWFIHVGYFWTQKSAPMISDYEELTGTQSEGDSKKIFSTKDPTKWTEAMLRKALEYCDMIAPARYIEQQLTSQRLHSSHLIPAAVTFQTDIQMRKLGWKNESHSSTLQVRIDVGKPREAPLTPWTAEAMHTHFKIVQGYVKNTPNSQSARRQSYSPCLQRIEIRNGEAKEYAKLYMEYGRLSITMIETLLGDLRAFVSLVHMAAEVKLYNELKKVGDRLFPLGFCEIERLESNRIVLGFDMENGVFQQKLTVTCNAIRPERGSRPEKVRFRLQISPYSYPQLPLLEIEVNEKKQIVPLLGMIHKAHKFVRELNKIQDKTRQESHPALLEHSSGILVAAKEPDGLALNLRLGSAQQLDIKFEQENIAYLTYTTVYKTPSSVKIEPKDLENITSRWADQSTHMEIQKFFEERSKSKGPHGYVLDSPLVIVFKPNAQNSMNRNSIAFTVKAPVEVLNPFAPVDAKKVVEAYFRFLIAGPSIVNIKRVMSFLEQLRKPVKILIPLVEILETEIRHRRTPNQGLQIRAIPEKTLLSQDTIAFTLQLIHANLKTCAFVRFQYGVDSRVLSRISKRGDFEQRLDLFSQHKDTLRNHLERISKIDLANLTNVHA